MCGEDIIGHGPVRRISISQLSEVCSLLCINDEEKSGVVLGYISCVFLSSVLRRPRGLSFHLFIPCLPVPD